MSEKQCKTCRHYLRHYTMAEGRIFQVYCGHCTFGKVKTKRPDAKACDRYELGTPLEDAFVSKKYLTKELLRYVLSLDLLPEIGEQK